MLIYDELSLDFVKILGGIYNYLKLFDIDVKLKQFKLLYEVEEIFYSLAHINAIYICFIHFNLYDVLELLVVTISLKTLFDLNGYCYFISV